MLEIHSVGSTAVPELAAKPEIDILGLVDLTPFQVSGPDPLKHWAIVVAATCLLDTIP
ncbi:GrpB family protein [Bradyrhizobium sp.]|uniref:GrpB family protein n=1 Tax=Bradyrhizobium sp. TaxID=376 RepID=UPI003C44C650